MEPRKYLSAESGSIFREGIVLVLSRWSALQIAVENEWGGRDSRRKADLLASEIFNWFAQSTGTYDLPAFVVSKSSYCSVYVFCFLPNLDLVPC